FDIYLITFSYGQRARREISRARRFSRILNAKDHRVVDIGFMKSLYGKSNALTYSGLKLPGEFEESLIVPVRNAVFITIASAWAMSIGARMVAYGAHTGDVSSYPDCRPEFALALANALNLAEADSISSGRRQGIKIVSPATEDLDKAALLQAGNRILGDKIFQTWSCYSNGTKSGNDYIHCGHCESCINRKVSFISAQIEDKTRYAENSPGNQGS
ncbi:MAG TPA: 7-cyano-7-deazaguanine synthase, partial [Nitrososphaera sp.]|nr:7-cyano-7-deazaguanine synthase [Nitrososphaera sp.]